MWGDLILGFHIPETLLIRELLALRVGPPHYGKHPGCPGEEEAPEKQIMSKPSGWVGAAFPRDEASQRECRAPVPAPGACLPWHKMLRFSMNSQNPIQELVKQGDSPKALQQRDSHTLAVHTKQGIR